jgi:hypothetical protein
MLDSQNSNKLMPPVLAFVLIYLVLGCGNKKQDSVNATKRGDLKSISFDLRPSFIPLMKVTIDQSESHPLLDIQISNIDYQEIDTLIDGQKSRRIVMLPEQTLRTKRIKIDSSDINGIKFALAEFLKNYKGPQEDTGLDGNGVNMIMDYSLQKDTIHFWSPDRTREPEYYKIVDPLFALLYKYFNSGSDTRYIEDLEGYFDFGFPIKKTSDNPLTFHVYGHIGDFPRTALKDFVAGLPTDGRVVMDLTNLGSVPPVYYDAFYQGIFQKNKSVEWLVTDYQKKELTEIGVPGKIKILNIENDW